MKNMTKWFRRNGIGKYFGIGLALVLLLTAIILPFTPKTAYATVSVVGEQGIELVVDKDMRILQAKQYIGANEWVHLKELTGKKITDPDPTVQKLLASKGENLLIAYALSDDGEKDNSKIQNWRDETEKNHSMRVLKGDKADLAAAKAENKSLGVYLTEKLIRENRLEEAIKDVPLNKLVEQLANHPDLKKNPEIVQNLMKKLDDGNAANINQIKHDRGDDNGMDDDDRGKTTLSKPPVPAVTVQPVY
ncbi:MAG: hypothetical protein Q4G61_10790, partial [Tissierellia bacterium]|nr:hypothetical protein [Tissierellia bacterium]